ncbi:hypothetical protein [Sinomonas terrae]|uniref:Uncharacterized protein n=1 Tax=Sinomonas terrae TaxID=2908838 RepID=A0ABS9U3Y2_9MICC|nr:hypothetical protein [Sinomonas terrae]MCH6470980.1 hypothetical protein [Sinomonas terrae]
MFARVVLSALGGLFVGMAVLVIVLIAAVAFGWATGTRAYLPGIFEAWFTEENGLPAVNFVPNAWGMLAVVLVVSAASAAVSVRRRRKGN